MSILTTPTVRKIIKAVMVQQVAVWIETRTFKCCPTVHTHTHTQSHIHCKRDGEARELKGCWNYISGTQKRNKLNETDGVIGREKAEVAEVKNRRHHVPLYPGLPLSQDQSDVTTRYTSGIESPSVALPNVPLFLCLFCWSDGGGTSGW